MNQENKTSRRAFVTGAATAAAVLAAAPAMAMNGHEHHHPAPDQGLIDAALACVKESEICAEHCLVLLKDGDTTLAKCLETAKEAADACVLLAKFAAGESPNLKKLAQLCIDVCETCAKECEKHAKNHQSCKDCLDSCVACIDACKKVA